MANDAIELFNFYRRYLWTDVDFTDWQTGMVDYARSLFEGTFNGAVLGGGAITINNLQVTIAALIGVAPQGNPLVINSSSSVTFTAPGSNSRRDLIVMRPKVVQSDPITNPTDPNATVFLKQLQQAEILIIEGTAALTPAYPSKGANDVILCGVRIASGQTALTSVDIDLEVRDIPGRNSNFQQNQAKYDDRLRPFKYTNNQLGIKPSQLGSPLPISFSYVNRQSPSIFPKDLSGNYVNGDTYIDFTTGSITGADEVSTDFTPTIPSAGNAIVATVALTASDTIAVTYGTVGTRIQCYDGIRNQLSAGAGSVSLISNTKPIAFCILFSADGASITDYDFIDCRGAVGTGNSAAGVAGFGVITPGGYPYSITADISGAIIAVDTSAARTLNLPTPDANLVYTIKDVTGSAGTFPITVARSGSESIENLAANYSCSADYGSWTFSSDGTNWFLI